MKNIVMIFSCLLETEVRRSEIKALLSINASSYVGNIHRLVGDKYSVESLQCSCRKLLFYNL